MKLVTPHIKHKEMAIEYKYEHWMHGERRIHGSSLWDKTRSYNEWLNFLSNNENTPNWVPFSTFFAMNEEEEKIIGMISVRHYLNDALKEYGGHIGYGVRPSERGQGYATEILKLGLEYAKTELGLEEVMLTCGQENIASQNVILKNGGVLEKEFEHSNGEMTQMYLIRLN